MDKRTKEAVRYLGYGNHAVDEDTLLLIEGSFQELEKAADKRIVYRIFDLFSDGGDEIRIGDLSVKSHSLSRNLKGCMQVILLGATLGTRVDMLLRRYAVSEMARSVTLQACAAAVLEEYLDEWQEEQKRRMEKKGLYLRPRFSPGYGDFSILCQKPVLRMLDASRAIGLSMTDGYMLTPSKSVTALIGISSEKTDCHRKGCEECGKKDCLYRRDGQRREIKGADRC